MSAKTSIEVLFNGPALAGIGATTDAGLVPSKFHVLPWDPKERTAIEIRHRNGNIEYHVSGNGCNRVQQTEQALQYAIHNVDNVFGVDEYLSTVNAMGDEEKSVLRRDMIAIVFLMIAYGYYDNECRAASANETEAINEYNVEDDLAERVVNVEALNRAATFILARMHTKYQTNHVLGGSPMQASMASAVRAYYSISHSPSADNSTKARLNAYATALHWALHPANERLLIPAVISNSKIISAYAHTEGPEIVALGKEEYFTIRSNTPPASTHHYYVAAAAVQHLEPLGILPYLPTISQMKDIQTGWLMIESHGAKLHPAARHWGLTRVTANQKIVEPVCADLGYAVKKLMPMSSLAESPILKKEDALNATWKKFIDALRAAMDKHGEELLDTNIFDDIKASIMPEKRDDRMIQSVKKLLIGNIEEAQDDEDESSESSDDDDDTPRGPPPSGPAPPDSSDDENSSGDDDAPKGSTSADPGTSADAPFPDAPSGKHSRGKRVDKGKGKARGVFREISETPGVLESGNTSSK